MLWLRVLAVCSVLVSCAYVWDLRSASHAPNQCEMTYSYPVYTRMQQIRHHKYTLYRYHMHEYQKEFKDIPLVFVPGHLGSYKQVRSIGSHLYEQNPSVYEVFALDFQMEMTALSGKILLQQADFLRSAINVIQEEYRKQHKPNPDKFVIVAHSMGGIVALAANLLLPANANAAARRRPITKGPLFAHVVTLGTPFEKPPLALDPDMQDVYDEVSEEMKKLLTRTATGRVGRRTGVAVKQEQMILESRAHISIAGGHRDTLVHSSLSTLTRYQQPGRRWNGLAVLTKAMPGVNTTVDHLCLLWCHQLLKSVAHSLMQIIETQSNSESGTSYRLMQTGRRRLELTRQSLIGNSTLGSEIAVHAQITANGYVDQEEFDSYKALLPMKIVNFLRGNLYGVLLVICHVVVLQIVHLQISKWLSQSDANSSEHTVQGTSVAVTLFPSFTDFLSPIAHFPTFLKDIFDEALVSLMEVTGMSKYMSSSALFGGVAAALLCGVMAIALGIFQHPAADFAGWTRAAENLGLHLFVYFNAVGLLYAIGLVGKLAIGLLQLVVVPLHCKLQPRFNRWLFCLVVLLLVFTVGHVKSIKPFSWVTRFMMSREIALGFTYLYVLAATFMLECFIIPGATDDHTRYKQAIGAFYLLFGVWHIGKITYVLNAVRLPPRSDPLIAQFASEPFVLALCLYHLFLVNKFMLPSPPQMPSQAEAGGFLGATGVDDEGKPFTAANCPKCVYEDAGPGAVFEEFTDDSTKEFKSSAVVVGASFRVVSCDCVFRFTSPKDYCMFCLRSCHLCGGGQGNQEKAQQLRESIAMLQSELMGHRLVAFCFALASVLEVYFGLYRHREHLVYHFSVLLVLVLVGYQHAAGETASLPRRRRRSRRRSGNSSSTTKRKSSGSAKSKTTKAKSKSNTNSKSKTSTKTPSTSADLFTNANPIYEPVVPDVPASA